MAETALRAMRAKEAEDKENDLTYSFAAMSDLQPHQKTLLEKVGLLKQKRNSGPEIVHFLVGRTVANAESFSIPMHVIRLSKSPLVRALRSGDQIRVEARKRIFKVCLKYLETTGSSNELVFPDPDIAPRDFISLAVLANMFGLDSLLVAIENSPMTPAVVSADLEANSSSGQAGLIAYSSSLLERLSSNTGAGGRLMLLIEDYLLSSIRCDPESVPSLMLLSHRHKLARLTEFLVKSKVVGDIDAWQRLRCEDNAELPTCVLMMLCAVVQDKDIADLAALALRRMCSHVGTKQQPMAVLADNPSTIVPPNKTETAHVTPPVTLLAQPSPPETVPHILRLNQVNIALVVLISILVYCVTRN